MRVCGFECANPWLQEGFEIPAEAEEGAQDDLETF